MIKTAVVILNYNGKDYLQKFLPGVIKYSPNCQVVVADNCSTDNSVSYLRKDFPSITLIELSTNAGYSAGYNQALRQVEAEFYILLNSDVEVTEGWVDEIIHLMDEDTNIAAAQPKILDYNRPEYFEYAGAAGGFIDSLAYPFCRGRIFSSLEKDNGQYDDTKKIFWATGACLFIRSKVYHELGGLDDDFFAHMEEIDLCWRINSAGYTILYNGASRVYHVGGGTLHKSNPMKTYLNFRNGLVLLYKNTPLLSSIWKLPLRIFLDLVAAMQFLISGSARDAGAVLKAHFHFLSQLRNNTRKRKVVRSQARNNQISTIYSGSIVYDYYLKGKKKFGELMF